MLTCSTVHVYTFFMKKLCCGSCKQERKFRFNASQRIVNCISSFLALAVFWKLYRPTQLGKCYFRKTMDRWILIKIATILLNECTLREGNYCKLFCSPHPHYLPPLSSNCQKYPVLGYPKFWSGSRMHMLIWFFTVRMCPKVYFMTLWLIWQRKIINYISKARFIGVVAVADINVKDITQTCLFKIYWKFYHQKMKIFR